MRRVRAGVYRCTICDETIFAGGDASLAATFVNSGTGNAIERVITAGEVEIHRCVYATAGRAPDGRLAQPRSGLTLFEQRRNRVSSTVLWRVAPDS